MFKHRNLNKEELKRPIGELPLSIEAWPVTNLEYGRDINNKSDDLPENIPFPEPDKFFVILKDQLAGQHEVLNVLRSS